MKSYGVTIQMKPLQQYFHMVLFIYHVVLTFEPVEKILRCDHSNETSLVVLSHDILQDEVWKFCWSLTLATFGSERVNIVRCFCCDRPSTLASFVFFICSVLSVRASPRPDIGDSLVSSSTAEPGTSSTPDTSRDGHNSSSGNRPRVGGASKGPVPKWFKGAGKGVSL